MALVWRDDKEAVRLFRLAADRGLALAQNNLGTMYRAGFGVERDDKEAVRLFRLAADRGLALAQCNLGVMYAAGRGVPKSPSEARKWLRKAEAGRVTAATTMLRQLDAVGD